jgi:hypothetical protein
MSLDQSYIALLCALRKGALNFQKNMQIYIESLCRFFWSFCVERFMYRKFYLLYETVYQTASGWWCVMYKNTRLIGVVA